MAVVTSCRSIVGSTAWFHTGTCVTGTCIWRGCLHLCLLPFVPWEGVVLHCRKFVQGRYKSVMAVVTSCRSDMSSKGLSPHGHLCDGRLHLVLVHASSRLQYLRFLSSIPQEGMLLTTSSCKSCCFSIDAHIHSRLSHSKKIHSRRHQPCRGHTLSCLLSLRLWLPPHREMRFVLLLSARGQCDLAGQQNLNSKLCCAYSAVAAAHKAFREQ